MTEKKKKTNTNLIRPWLRHWPNLRQTESVTLRPRRNAATHKGLIINHHLCVRVFHQNTSGIIVDPLIVCHSPRILVACPGQTINGRPLKNKDHPKFGHLWALQSNYFLKYCSVPVSNNFQCTLVNNLEIIPFSQETCIINNKINVWHNTTQWKIILHNLMLICGNRILSPWACQVGSFCTYMTISWGVKYSLSNQY